MAFNKGSQYREDLKYAPKTNKRSIEETENVRDWIFRIREGKETSEELIPLIISEIEAKPIYYSHVHEMCKHLEQILKFFYRHLNVKVVPFGSADTRLAITDSDVDIFLDFRGTLPEPPEKLLKTLKNKVRKYGYFIRTIPIFAKIPIIQCSHRSGLSCDLSFLNSAAVSNSQLIKFMLSLDVRIRPIILMIKYLLKSQKLIGAHAVTSYSLVLLILFFLQTLENPILPSISLLQNLEGKPNLIGDWDTSFSTESSQLPTVNNNLCITELIQKFFQFYSTFEFGFYVISLYTGKSYLKTIFSDPHLLPEEFHLFKKNLAESKSCEFEYNKFMCVQDPFNHNVNVTRNTTQKSLIQFQKLCSYYATTEQQFSDNDSGKKKYLIQLFDPKLENEHNKKIKIFEPIDIYVGQNLLFQDPKCTENDLRNEWSESVFNTVVDILSKVMKCDLEIQSAVPENASTSSEIEEKLIHCEFHHYELITKVRNEVKIEFEFPEGMTAINQEEILSNYLCDTLLKDSKKLSLKFDISCSIKTGPTCFCMNFSPDIQKKFNQQIFQQIIKFLQSFLMKCIK